MWTLKLDPHIGDKMRFLTVEPVMFLQMVGDTLTFVIYQNLFIEKICLNELKYNAEVCKIYSELGEIDEHNPAQQFMIPIVNEIQKSSSIFVLYNSLVENSLPVILVLFLGVWSDAKRRRKPPLLLSLFGKLFRSIGLLLNAWFINWPVIDLLLLAALPHSLGGANAVFHMAAFSYIADSSAPRNRTWRLGCAEAFWLLGSPIGLTLGAYLFKHGGYLCVFSTAVIFHLIGVLYTAFLLPEVPQPKPAQYNVGKHGWYGTWHTESFDAASTNRRVRYYSDNINELDPTSSSTNNNSISETQSIFPNEVYKTYTEESNSENTLKNISVKQFLVEAAGSIVKKRPNHTRKCLLSLGFIMLLVGLVYHGELNMKYLFTRNKFQWREQEFSNWVIFEGIMMIIGVTIIMPISSKILKLSDPFAGIFASLARLCSRAFYAFANTSKLLYIGSIIEIPGIMVALSARSLASKCVQRDERGKVFAFLGCIEALVPLMAVPLYSLVYSNTLTYDPSAIYYLSCGIYFLIFLTFGVLFIVMKIQIVQFTGTDVSNLTDPLISVQSVPNTATTCYRRTSLS